jgi:hypothetical protein
LAQGLFQKSDQLIAAQVRPAAQLLLPFRLLAVGEQLIGFTLQLLQLRFQLSDLILRIRYQALPFGEVAGVGVCCDFVALQSARARLMAWAENTRQAAWAIAGLGPIQPAQICSRSSASPGKWGAASRWVADFSRRGWARESASGSQISTAYSAGIKSQPRRAPLRW